MIDWSFVWIVVVPTLALIAIVIVACNYMQVEDAKCRAAGGDPHRGRGIFLCLKPGLEVEF